MKDGLEEFNESEDFMMEFKTITNAFHVKDPGKGKYKASLKTIYMYLNEDWSHLNKQEILTLMKKLSIICYETLEKEI